MNLNLVQNFGYAEMYEFAENPKEKFGRFVTFDKEVPNKIKFASKNDFIIGVSSINFNGLSDNLKYWRSKYCRDMYGDCYLNSVTLAKGKKVYNSIEEMAYIETSKVDTYKPKQFDYFNDDQEYIERIDRIEWVPVTLLGKAIVVDNGNCNPGDWCQLYDGDDESLLGTAIKWNGDKNVLRWHVLERYSIKTIKILYK